MTCNHIILITLLWGQDSYLLQYCQALVDSQSISQSSGSRMSNSILSKTAKESTHNVTGENQLMGQSVGLNIGLSHP